VPLPAVAQQDAIDRHPGRRACRDIDFFDRGKLHFALVSMVCNGRTARRERGAPAASARSM